MLFDKAAQYLASSKMNVRERLFELFKGQDDHMIQMLNGTQVLYISLRKPSNRLLSVFQHTKSKLDDTIESLHPHLMFLEILNNIGYDDSVLLDFLISSETEFLPYFTRYLHFLLEEWDVCMAITKTKQEILDDIDEEDEVDILGSLMMTFSTLRDTIEKLSKNNIFPYNARPLLTLLRKLDQK